METESWSNHPPIPFVGTDNWEIDARLLTFGNILGSGSSGVQYKGIYCSQEVAIKEPKVLEAESSTGQAEQFFQEVSIMRNVRHKNVIQFIGACTRPKFYIVTEFMSGGSIHDYLHKQKGVFGLLDVLRLAIDVSKGMNYLHQNKIIHRDLKASNLLMDDERKVVKVSDFGVARVQAESGIMTKETGTYRWMAPEVIKGEVYNHKADIFSFAIVIWEMLTGKCPYADLNPLQVVVGVAFHNLRPEIPEDTHPQLVQLIKQCWQWNPSLRPDFSEILECLELMANEVALPESTQRVQGSSTPNSRLVLTRELHSSSVKIIQNEDLTDLREFGFGTFVTFYHGKCKTSQIVVKQIKPFPGRLSKQDELTSNFWREAEILSKLEHPKIVTFHGAVANGLAVVTEYMVDCTLRSVLDRETRMKTRGKLDDRSRLSIAFQAAQGMAYLHSQHVVHFDLKCSNLLLDLSGPKPICKIGDFGLFNNKMTYDLDLDVYGKVGGLPWMAPELLRGSITEISEKADVFSFGIVLWEILTNEVPYTDMTFNEIYDGVKNNELRPKVPYLCDRGWRKMMEDCWAQNPVVRPSFTDIATRLENMLN